MDNQTKADFLKQKLVNMANWVSAEVGKENLPDDLISGINSRSASEVALVCGMLAANKEMALDRDWGAILQVVTKEGLPVQLQQLVCLVRDRGSMHVKFWRYVDMFIEVAEQ